MYAEGRCLCKARALGEEDGVNAEILNSAIQR